MELEDLKMGWETANRDKEFAQKLTDDKINTMINAQVRLKLKNILYPELAGAAVCFAGAVYLGWNFAALDTVFLQTTGLASMVFLIVMPLISIFSLHQLRKIGHVTRPYKQTLTTFGRRRMRFLRFQQVNVGLGFLFMMAVIPVMSKIVHGVDITDSLGFWSLAFAVGFVFLWFFSRWVLRHYHRTLAEAHELLDIDAEQYRSNSDGE
jgi:hypothetical protein